MAIRKLAETDMPLLLKLFRDFYPIHNLFLKPDQEMVRYLLDIAKKHEALVLEESGSIKSAMFLECIGQDMYGSHRLWKFRHFAFTDLSAARQLVETAEQMVKHASPTAKIELKIASTEKHIDVYKLLGYELEGTLKNHYRWGEDCYIFSKSIS